MDSNEKFLSACGQRAIPPPLECRGLPSPERVSLPVLLIFLYRRTTAKLARRRAPGGIIGAIFPGLGDLSSYRKERDKHYEWSDDAAERTHAGTCEENGSSTLVE